VSTSLVQYVSDMLIDFIDRLLGDSVEPTGCMSVVC